MYVGTLGPFESPQLIAKAARVTAAATPVGPLLIGTDPIGLTGLGTNNADGTLCLGGESSEISHGSIDRAVPVRASHRIEKAEGMASTYQPP